MFDLLMSISRPNIPMLVNQTRSKTVDICIGLELLTKDVEKAWFPISSCWWDRDQVAPIKSHNIEITWQSYLKGGKQIISWLWN